MIMDLPGFSVRHSVEFLGFYLPPLLLCAGSAAVVFVLLRQLLARAGLYRFVWHRPLFDLALYVLLLGGVVFFGDRLWP
jgi:hypothetical protein